MATVVPPSDGTRSEAGAPEPSTPSAEPSEVFIIPEILETIFLNLTLPELLLPVPLVCRHWRDTILASPRLQQGLFFSPMPGGPFRLYAKPSGEVLWGKNKEDTQRHTIFRNPFYFKYSGCEFTPVQEQDRAKFEHPEASWRRMLTCQPPVKEVYMAAGDEYWAALSVQGDGNDNMRMQSLWYPEPVKWHRPSAFNGFKRIYCSLHWTRVRIACDMFKTA